ncbi:reverse transcriptase domain-containing protein [Tanacetum coccineum]
MPRMKLDSEFTPEETNRENADTQAEIILSQGLPRHIFNILNQTNTAKEIWDNVEMLMQGSGRTLQQRKEDLFDEFERFRAIGNEPIHDYFVRFHKLGGQHQPHLFQQSHILKPHPAVLYPNDALMATMEILIEKSFKWFPEAVSSYHNQLRRAPGNVGNTGSRGNQSYGNVTTATGKKVICYNCRGEGHVARQCKEPKRAKDSQYFKDKMLLMEAKEKGVTLDAEMKLPRQYGNDVDEGPNDCTAAFIGEICNHTSGNNHHVNELELERRAKVVPTEVSTGSSANISMVTILDEMRDTLDEKTQENQDLSLENQNLTAELAKCKLEIVRLDTQQVLTDKKKLEDKYLDEIVCLKSANKVATDLLQKFQMPTHTIPMLSKKPKNASQDLHKDILGRSNPRYGKKAPVINASNAWDTDETLASAEVSMAKMKGKPGHVRPESGFYEKLNALKFVPQQELSREQVYWLPANEIASQASTPATPVTPYVPKSPPPSQVLATLHNN